MKRNRDSPTGILSVSSTIIAWNQDSPDERGIPGHNARVLPHIHTPGILVVRIIGVSIPVSAYQ